MGTYNNSEKEIVEKLAESLDSIEGDFDKETLFGALEKLKQYPYLTNFVSKKQTEAWEKYINSIN